MLPFLRFTIVLPLRPNADDALETGPLGARPSRKGTWRDDRESHAHGCAGHPPLRDDTVQTGPNSHHVNPYDLAYLARIDEFRELCCAGLMLGPHTTKSVKNGLPDMSPLPSAGRGAPHLSTVRTNGAA